MFRVTLRGVFYGLRLVTPEELVSQAGLFSCQIYVKLIAKLTVDDQFSANTIFITIATLIRLLSR